jgi:radical SAM superfamily enzyme YgiQ (UPF0313 family)
MTSSPTIILTADETMMSRYRGGMFLGFATCAPKGVIPDCLFFAAFAPPVKRESGRAMYADFGTRIIESSLLAHGFTEDEVAVVHPRDLAKMVGRNTSIISVSGHDLLGINPPTSTFVDFIRSGPPYNRVKFLQLMRHPAMKKVTTVVGGKAAWQVAHEPMMDRLGIDYVHLGEGEISVPRMFRSILDGEEIPRICSGEEAPLNAIPCIRHPTIHGLVEISRGCVRGCSFCTPGMQHIRHKPVEQVLKDVQVNADAGNSSIILHAEDVLCYGSPRIGAQPEKVLDLFRRVAKVNGVGSVNPSHLALATVYHHPSLLEELSEFLATLPDQTFNGAQTGIETASGRLMALHMKGKVFPSPPEKWPEIVAQSLGILADNNWILACTMIIGLPDEREEDLQQTLDLLDDIKGMRGTFLVPMNFVSMDPARLSDKDSFTLNRMTPAHWELFGRCLEHDVRLARELREYIVEGNVILRNLSRFCLNFFMNGTERYARMIRTGNPPPGFDPAKKNYLVPEV